MAAAQNKEKAGERPKYTFWQNAAYMIRLGWKNRKSVLLLCLSLAALSVASSLVELFIAPAILEKVETAVPIFELLITISGFVAALMVLKALSAYASSNTLYGRISIRTDIVNSIHRKLATTSYPNTEDASVLKKLEKANIAVSSNDQATEAVWNTLTGIVENLLGFCIHLFLLSWLNPFLIIVTLTTTAAGYFINKRINEWGYRHREEASMYSKRMNYISGKSEDVTLAKDVRIFNMRPWLEGIYAGTLRLYDAFVSRREKAYIWADVVDVVLSLLRNGIAYAYLVGLTLQNGLSASQFLLYFSAVGGFTTWVTGVLSGFSTLHKQSLDISTVREFLVSFRYPGAQKDTLRNIDLTIRPAEKLAIVGLNGAGKTTLVKLICGFYDPAQGEVLLNGKNIKEYNRRDYYDHFSAVFQQFSLIEATLAENVAQADDPIDLAKVSDCIGKAGLADKAKSLPNGYDTHIGRKVFEDGVELSGGETQRLMLARALYKDASVIVLDEPTAALDPIAENDIYQKYNELTAGRTSIYISHRLASTRFCDRILYLEDATIAEEGTHASLLASGGKYATLFSIQSRYYKAGGEADEKT